MGDITRCEQVASVKRDAKCRRCLSCYRQAKKLVYGTNLKAVRYQSTLMYCFICTCILLLNCSRVLVPVPLWDFRLIFAWLWPCALRNYDKTERGWVLRSVFVPYVWFWHVRCSNFLYNDSHLVFTVNVCDLIVYFKQLVLCLVWLYCVTIVMLSFLTYVMQIQSDALERCIVGVNPKERPINSYYYPKVRTKHSSNQIYGIVHYYSG